MDYPLGYLFGYALTFILFYSLLLGLYYWIGHPYSNFIRRKTQSQLANTHHESKEERNQSDFENTQQLIKVNLEVNI